VESKAIASGMRETQLSAWAAEIDRLKPPSDSPNRQMLP